MDETLAVASRRLAQSLRDGSIATREDWQVAKRVVAHGLGMAQPTDRDLVPLLPDDVRERHGAMLRTKPMRSRSGVAVVAVMSSPAGCPHGKCIFCPGGPEVDAPQSYTGFEPSTMRARRHGYDPCAIVRGRLAQLRRNGHTIDKVDVVVQGGTFPARDAAYQDWFIAGTYAGLNAGPEDALLVGPAPSGPLGSSGNPGNDQVSPSSSGPEKRAQTRGAGSPERHRGLQATEDMERAEQTDPGSASSVSAAAASPAALWSTEAEWAALPADERRRRLDALMLANEAAACRAIGLTIETKPDWCLESDIDRMLGYGATRVEIGLQALDDDVLRRTHRGHTLEDSRRSMQLARDAGLKVCVHMMPGLPRGRSGPSDAPTLAAKDGAAPAGHTHVPLHAADPWATDEAADIEDMRRLFQDEAWRPDMLKVYPTLVVEDGETPLKRLWQEGKYVPYDTAAATRVVGAGKGFVPEWCRIQRIDRDIPTTHVEAGVANSNLRQLAQAWRAGRGLPACRCIRCREVGAREGVGRRVDADRLQLVRRDYAAAGGDEAFLSFEDLYADAIVAFLRLRRTGPDTHRPELRGAAVVRELKVYGTTTAIGDDPESGQWQHRGLGARLLAEAERIAGVEWGVGRIAVLAGPGVKAYYRRFGYADDGPYLAKALARGAGPAQAGSA